MASCVALKAAIHDGCGSCRMVTITFGETLTEIPSDSLREFLVLGGRDWTHGGAGLGSVGSVNFSYLWMSLASMTKMTFLIN